MQYMLLPFQQPLLLLLIAIGVFVGIYVAAIPGLTGTMAVSLLVSFTYGWDVNAAIALMIGIFNGASYGGSRSAILLNIPGAPAAVATALDGYPLARSNESGHSQSAYGCRWLYPFTCPAVSQTACRTLRGSKTRRFGENKNLGRNCG